MADHPSIDTLLEQCILALEGGTEGGVDALLAAHPEHAATLRARLDNLAALGILQQPRAAPAIPERLGEFRLLRRIGRGGMGIVYLAEQTALQRHVALKLVHPEHLFFPGARERFRREVLAIARLQHPGIVPILTGGEAEGIPFYAMELVAGASLAEVLTELHGTALQALDGPLLRAALPRAMAKKQDDTPVDDASTFRGAWTKVACRLVLDAAEALQHAHEQGVLHRDLKPSNLLLTTTGRVRLIDFGLAISAGEQRITRSGTTFGSLPYMAPEQVRGETQRFDARTDVYQLGVTLYELLALELPHGNGSPGTRERILAGDVEPPSRRNAQVHADAEAVCLKAMDVDPARRYATAREFAADLRAFLEHRSVQARRAPALLRLHRWARHRPGRAAAAALAFFVAVPAPLAFALQQNVANASITKARDDAEAQRRQAEGNLAEAHRQRTLAEQNLEHALEAVDQMLLRTADSRLADLPHTAVLRRDLLQDAVGIHERLGAAAGIDSERVRAARARVQVRLGALQTDLSVFDQALTQLTQARAVFAALLPDSDQRDRLLSDMARCDNLMATVYERTDRRAEQAAALERARGAYQDLAARLGENRFVEASTRTQLSHARCLAQGRDFERAFHELDDLDRRLAKPDAGVAALPLRVRILLAGEIADQRGVFHAQRGETMQALDAFRESLRRVEEVPPELADDQELVLGRLGAVERLGLLHHQRREWDVAQPLLDRVCAGYESAFVAEPAFTSSRRRLARVLQTRATNGRHRGDMTACAADHDRAIQLLDTIVAQAPDDADGRRGLAAAFAERAGFRLETRDLNGAFADFERAEREFEACLLAAPDNRQTTHNLGAALCNHAIAKTRTRDFAAARPLIQRALELNRTLTGREAERSAIEMLSLASDVALHLDDVEGAQRHMLDAVQRANVMVEQRPDDASAIGTAVYVGINHGTLLLSLKRPDEALALWTAQLPLAERVGGMTSFGRMLHGTLLLRIADLHTRHDRIEQAREAFAAAIRAGAKKAHVAPFPPLPALFERADFADLLPKEASSK